MRARVASLICSLGLTAALIGVASLAFHKVFLSATGFAFEAVIPQLGSPAAVHAFKCLLLRNTGFAAILPDLMYLGLFSAIAMTAATLLFRRVL